MSTQQVFWQISPLARVGRFHATSRKSTSSPSVSGSCLASSILMALVAVSRSAQNIAYKFPSSQQSTRGPTLVHRDITGTLCLLLKNQLTARQALCMLSVAEVQNPAPVHLSLIPI